jgi:hypothetical protein
MNPKSQGPIDVLICVADADRASQCCPALENPERNTPTNNWITEANEAWTEHLRTFTKHKPTRIFGRFIRWNKESIVISCFDQEDVVAQLCLQEPSPDVLDHFLGNCNPDPRSNTDAEFVDTYRSPGRCLEGAMQELGHTNPNKNQQEVNDALSEFPRVPSASLLNRMPDFVQLAELINGLNDQLPALIGVTQAELQDLINRQPETNQERLEIISEAQRLLGTDYRILGRIALMEEQTQEHRIRAARLFSTLFDRDDRSPTLQMDEQATLNIFNDLDDELLQEAVMEGLCVDE